MKHQQVQCLEKAYFLGLHRWKLLDVVSGARHRALILFIRSPHPWPSCCLTTVPGQSSGDQRTITSAIVWYITEGLQYAERPPEPLATLSIMCTVLLGFLVIPVASEAQLCLPYSFYLCTVLFFLLLPTKTAETCWGLSLTEHRKCGHHYSHTGWSHSQQCGKKGIS